MVLINKDNVLVMIEQVCMDTSSIKTGITTHVTYMFCKQVSRTVVVP